MFDEIDFNNVDSIYDSDFNPFPIPVQKVNEMVSSYIIIHHCCCCGRKVETYWDKFGRIQGKYQALDRDFSEVFGRMVDDPQRILCNRCFGQGTFKLKGIEL